MAAPFDSIALSVVGVSLALNGYFLKRVVDRVEHLATEQGKHGSRLTAVEVLQEAVLGRTSAPHRRFNDIAAEM